MSRVEVSARPTWTGVWLSRELWWIVPLGIVAVGLRVLWIGVHPGYEWDEPVYTYIAANLAANGLLEGKTEYYRTMSEPYLYHPPFYFALLAGWFKIFGAGIVQARWLALLGSIAMFVFFYLLLRSVVGWRWAVGIVGLTSIDAWLVFTNRVSWIENTMMPIGVAALWLYYRYVLDYPIVASRRGRAWPWAGVASAGILLGLVTVYKHVGVYFVLAVLVCWLVTRSSHKRHIVALGAYMIIVAGYVAGMSLYFEGNFVSQVNTQVRRSLGIQESRGALTSVADIVGPLTAQYAIYWPTVLVSGLAMIVLVWRTVSLMRRRSMLTHGEATVYSWALAAVLFFAVLQLKIPHYFLMLQVPLYGYLGMETYRYVRGRKDAKDIRIRRVLVAVVLTMIAANVFAITMRMAVLDGNPLSQTASWTAANIPPTATVVTEESVGTSIVQPYCKLAFARYCQDAEYLIIYTSATQQPPDSRSVQVLRERAVPLTLFKGFKEEISIYQLT